MRLGDKFDLRAPTGYQRFGGGLTKTAFAPMYLRMIKHAHITSSYFWLYL